MGLISAKQNISQELTRQIKNCELCGLMFPAKRLENIHRGLEKSYHSMEYDFSQEAEELLLLGNWLLFFRRELEIEEVKANLIKMQFFL